MRYITASVQDVLLPTLSLSINADDLGCSYFSVSHPFRGDYVSLRQNQKWRKIACETNDQQLVFADIVNKINRKNGKVRVTVGDRESESCQ